MTCSEKLSVAVLTSPQAAAMATVALWGDHAEEILRQLFSKPLPKNGYFQYGNILSEQGKPLDSVIVGREAPNVFTVHCHGNPLIVEALARHFSQHGAALKPADAFFRCAASGKIPSCIQQEAIEIAAKTACRQAAEWAFCQTQTGLAKWAKQILANPRVNVEQIHTDCRDILRQSRAFERLSAGVRIVLLGAANSGKSTLFNWLVGKQGAIASPTAGTTRDWITADCAIRHLRAQIVDTAGLDFQLIATDEIQKQAQQAALRQAENADLILLIVDASQPQILPEIGDFTTPALAVYTKIDIADPSRPIPPNAVSVSAVKNEGLERLCDQILDILGLKTLDYSQPTVFTDRQKKILQTLLTTEHHRAVNELLTRLLFENL